MKHLLIVLSMRKENNKNMKITIKTFKLCIPTNNKINNLKTGFFSGCEYKYYNFDKLIDLKDILPLRLNL